MKPSLLTGPRLTRFFLLGLPVGLILGGIIAVLLWLPSQNPDTPRLTLPDPLSPPAFVLHFHP